jgi:glucose-6-phosphate 1-dehydrogenase
MHIDTWRWAGVPFYIRTGKNMPVTATEIRVDFRPPPQAVFDDGPPCEANYIRFRLSPTITISLGARVKVPGEAMAGEAVELILRQAIGDELTPYERLLGDAIRGDPLLFVRQDSVEAAWEVADQVLAHVTPAHAYEPQSWGPIEADDLASADGGWRNPLPTVALPCHGGNAIVK